MKNANSVESYIDSRKEWVDTLQLLREIFRSTEMEETVKWGMPTYTVNRKNVAGYSAFKSYVGIWFHQGVFLSDPHEKLVSAQEGVTKALRQLRFSSKNEVEENREMILEYLEEAIQNQKEGKEIKPERNKSFEIPEELQQVLNSDPAVRDRFVGLSHSRRREYAEYVAGARREITRKQRLEKIVHMILEGVGLNDRYKRQG
jgi:uncharacterized protein YdeI (YjbR/CyaY-like superfamily)